MSRGDDLTAALDRRACGKLTVEDAVVFADAFITMANTRIAAREELIPYLGQPACGDDRCGHAGCLASRVQAALDGR